MAIRASIRRLKSVGWQEGERRGGAGARARSRILPGDLGLQE